VSGFYEVGPLRQVAINLFYGWGYNFYRQENQLRADDQLVRAKAAGLLGAARAAVETAESAYRRAHIPPLSRANPLPDPAAVAGAQALERLSKGVGALEGRLHSAPVPENDRMTQRYRQEAATLAALGEVDQDLIGQAELLRSLIDGRSGEAILEGIAELEQGLAVIAETLRKRQGMLS
jgi:predicted regulator of Ras-like GTPase activity (Roadblock/LC7/MglB family)